MKNRILSAFIVLLCGVVVRAQAQVQVSGEQTFGSRLSDVSTNSAKFNEYRDIGDGYYIPALRLDVLDTQRGRFLDFQGTNLFLSDQSLQFRVGDYRQGWRLSVNRDDIPHQFSNRAMTPYIARGNGVFTVPGLVSIVKDGNDATGTPSLVPTNSQMAVNDALIADYLSTYLHPEKLAVQRERTTASFQIAPAAAVKFRLTYRDERRDGGKLTYGPIGDRPPRTLNTQIYEPVDYTVREAGAEAEYTGARVQTRLQYLFSDFNNDVGAMRWENIFFEPDPGLDYIAAVPGTARNVSNFGQRSLAPDNFAHHVLLSGGVTLPRMSRLTATAALGFLRQNERLLPYSVSTLGGDLNATRGDGLDWNETEKLPRLYADAAMRTLRLDLDYSINPINRLNLQTFVRFNDLDNNTPMTDWRYVTQDAAGTDGDVNYRNYRRNLAYAFRKLTLGTDARYNFSFWRTTLGAGYSRVGIERDFRETDTDEDMITVSANSRPVSRLTVRTAYVHGDRRGDGYLYNVTSQSYWYSMQQGAVDPDNPQFLFANHPDLRKFDVSDRTRDEVNVSAAYMARDNLDITAAWRYRRDDFATGMEPVAPLAGTLVPLPNPADADALTPGRQLGMLTDERRTADFDVHYTPVERWNCHAFFGRELTASSGRGMVFNENARREPSSPAIQSPTQLGPWTDPDRQYDTKTEYHTTTLGLGIGHDLVPPKLRWDAEYLMSRSDGDLEYSGYGSDAGYLGRDWETFQFGFDDPETIRFNQYVFQASVKYQLQPLVIGVHYMYDRFTQRDWAQEPAGPWVEEVGSEYFWRDTSRDNRWGNRLVSMGGYLAPEYAAHVAYLTVQYHF